MVCSALGMRRPALLARMVAILAIGSVGCGQVAKLAVAGDSRELRERDDASRPDGAPSLLVIALDGAGRDVLYDEVQSGRLPGFSRLLYGQGDDLPHAHFNGSLLSTVPSTTLVAWATAFTGFAPAQHGIMGNEFFVRQSRVFAAPAPVSLSEPSAALANFTEDYLDEFCMVPTVYEQMRAVDQDVRIWVAMHPLHRGADRLLLTGRAALFAGFRAMLTGVAEETLEDETSREVYEQLDEEVIDTVLDVLDDETPPDVLTIYLVGIDAFAHAAAMGPDEARKSYLREALDPLMTKLAAAVERRMDDPYVVITTDHGHTRVMHDDRHALQVGEEDEPTAVLDKLGFRLRPHAVDVDADDPFSAVVAYQGAMAYVYLADRSTCPTAETPCDWHRPPRYEEDVLAVGQAFRQASDHGKWVPALEGTLDAVFVRDPVDPAANERPFAVLRSDGSVETMEAFSARRPEYLALAERMRHLAAGPLGERAGDVVLLARSSDHEPLDQRFYFAAGYYHSWHGSPSAQDSEIALIVSHPRAHVARTARIVAESLGETPFQYKVSDLLLRLRYGIEPVRALRDMRKLE